MFHVKKIHFRHNVSTEAIWRNCLLIVTYMYPTSCYICHKGLKFNMDKTEFRHLQSSNSFNHYLKLGHLTNQFPYLPSTHHRTFRSNFTLSRISLAPESLFLLLSHTSLGERTYLHYFI